ncbi:oxidoreductase [Acetobacter aceti]|uniref:Oxidoreductase n=2 Tax=Acetobacter aceti TaxID=435 RepID=A0A6S6PUJ5_ACEAC|nr:oxidoreductase [Acetobacter aceti]
MTVSSRMTNDAIERHTTFLNTLNRLDGRTAVVTGANSGLGLETACGLASLGARVILASRSEERNAAALRILQQRVPGAAAETAPLDLASLASIERFANTLRDRLTSLDILVNNAGVMAPPVRKETADGFEMQFGVNHLGHFALTGRLKPLLEASRKEGGVVVAVASLAAWKSRIHFDDLQSRHRYSPFDAYRQSKLANLLFGQELARRSRSLGWKLHARIAHPGWSQTQLVVNGPGSGKQNLSSWVMETGAKVAFHLFGQSAACGAEPFLYAAASPLAHDGCYYGPDGAGERTGKTDLAIVPPSAHDPRVARRLWEVSERLTGVTFE